MVTNLFFLKHISDDFFDWCDSNRKFEGDFDNIATFFENFIFSNYLNNRELSIRIIGKFQDVRSRCNYLSFNDDKEVIAYNILHFLIRYHRFQIIYTKLFEGGLLPVRNKPSNILEIGLGPGQGLYALADLFYNLKEYGFKRDFKRLKNLNWTFDYAEQSNSFRRWLHPFSEDIFCRKSRHPMVPFHLGSFQNFYDLDFQRMKQYLQQSLIEGLIEDGCSKAEAQYILDHEEKYLKNPYSYNMLIFSNFFTQLKDIPKMKNPIHSGCRALENGGIIVIVGANNGNYPAIYRQLSKDICSINYMEEVLNEKQNSILNDYFEERIIQYFDTIYHFFQNLEIENEIDPKIVEHYFNHKYSKSDTWKLLVFRKQLPHRTM